MKHWWELRREPLRIEPTGVRVGRYLLDAVCLVALVAFGAFVATAPDNWFEFDDPSPFPPVVEKAMALAGIALILGRWAFRGIRPSRALAERIEKTVEGEEEKYEKLDETWQFRKH